jgi:4-hydroxy-tetrahydrodipicolinate reductase
VAGEPDVEIVAGFDIVKCDPPPTYPVFLSPSEFTGSADVIVDFSAATALDSLLSYALDKNIPLVLCATGYTEAQLATIDKAAEQLPIFRSANMSLGINLLIDLIKRAAGALGDTYDIEIVERHHRRKIDAPSGTALMLADAVASSLPNSMSYTFERNSKHKPREKHEIGISSVRGGTIVGEHEVIFAGLDEVIELKHSAASREVFAVGALRAARFMARTSKPGLYTMQNIIEF